MNNADIRAYAKSHGVQFWKLADRLGISEPTFTRKLRHELAAEEKQKMLKLIDEIAEA